MRFGSLFSGIGGLDLGLERAGMTCAWQVEIDDYCTRVLEKHWPDIPKYKDVKYIETLPFVDVIAGGFPCQPVSYAGKQKGTEDARWLWPEFERIICMVRPRYVLVENVPGLLRRGMSDVLGGLAECGYDAEWESIPASAFGAPHRRDRIYIVAYSPSNRLEGELRQDSESKNGTSEALFTRNTEQMGMLVEYWQEQLAESHVSRMANGISDRTYRIRAIGNAVVPQVAEWIGRRIMEHERLGT